MSETKTSIGNKSLGMLGVSALNRLTDIDTDDTQVSAAILNVYDSLRRSELQRNVWGFAVRRRWLRAVDGTESMLIPATWSSATTYSVNDVVFYSSKAYRSRRNTNLAFTPVLYPLYWETLSTPLIAYIWASANNIAYQRHEIVSSGGAYWLALINGTAGTTTPAEGTSWHQLNTPASTATVVYQTPIDSRTYVFALPDDYLRQAPRDPKFIQPSNDWLIEGRMIVSNDVGPIAFRYVHDTEDINAFDALFVTALAARISLETCEEITQSSGKKRDVAAQYKQSIDDARRLTSIEKGPEEHDMDDWELVRSSGFSWAGNPFWGG